MFVWLHSSFGSDVRKGLFAVEVQANAAEFRSQDVTVPVESVAKGVGKEFTRTIPGYSIDVLDLAVQ